MSLNIWYISKYATCPPYETRCGARGFLILREFVRMGHKAVLIISDSNHLTSAPVMTGPVLLDIVEGVQVCWLRTWKYAAARSFGRMVSWLDFEWRIFRLPAPCFAKPDVIIVSSLSLLTILNGLLLRRRFKCKLVFEVRDIWPMVLIETGRFSRHNPLIRILAWIEKLGYRTADYIVGTMPNLREHVTNVLGQERSVNCVPQGLDESLLKASPPISPEYQKLYLPEGKFTVCHAGTIGADNALETLLACAEAMQACSEIHFLIVGEGPLKNEFEVRTRDLKNITFAPGVPKSSVQAVLSSCDLLYFAVHNVETMRYGQSLNKVIDYMLAGKPVLASYSGFPSMINEAGSGSYVPAEDIDALRGEIERYAKMPVTERKRLGDAGRLWLLKNRRFEQLAQQYLSLLDVSSFRSGMSK